MAPRASASHQGAPRPVNAGTTKTPSVVATLRAMASVSATLSMMPQLVAQPLDEGAGHEHAALERVLGAPRVGGRGRHRGHEPVLARAGLVPGVHEQKAAGAVGVLRLARMEAALAEERRLLVARHAADGDALDEPRVRRYAEAAGGGAHLGKHGLGNAEELKQERDPSASRGCCRAWSGWRWSRPWRARPRR